MSVSFTPSQAAKGRMSLTIAGSQQQMAASAILAYLIAHGDEWKEISWREFAQYLRSLPEGDKTPGANEAKSVFSWELMSALKRLISLMWIDYREDDGWNEYFSVTPTLMEMFRYLLPLPEGADAEV